MKTYVIEGATIYPISQPPMIGSVLVENGKITGVAEKLVAPEGAVKLDGRGKLLFPGFIDAHTHLGVDPEAMGWAGEDYNEKSNPVTPELDALDSLYPNDLGFREALAGGVTAAMITPGSANVIGGQCLVVKTRPFPLVSDMILRRRAGLKIAFGENPRRVYGMNGKTPTTRMGVAALLRSELQKAVEYRNKQRQNDEETGTAVDFGLENIGRVISGEMPLRAHAHRLDDIATAVRIAKEFDLDVVIEHATEGHKIADYLAEEEVSVLVGPTLTFRSKMEVANRSFHSLAILDKAGVQFGIISDHPVVPSATLPLYAGLAVRYGLSEEAALRAITLAPAKIMEVDDRIGSIEVGKDADLVLWQGHPFHTTSKPEWVMVDGALNHLTVALELNEAWEE